jgi:hypothetical protein
VNFSWVHSLPFEEVDARFQVRRVLQPNGAIAQFLFDMIVAPFEIEDHHLARLQFYGDGFTIFPILS